MQLRHREKLGAYNNHINLPQYRPLHAAGAASLPFMKCQYSVKDCGWRHIDPDSTLARDGSIGRHAVDEFEIINNIINDAAMEGRIQKQPRNPNDPS